MKHLTTLILGLSLIGCATSWKINGVNIGMTKSEVIKVMGQPVSVSAKDNTEYLNYKLSETDDDAFLGWTSQYYVRLINGKVDSYGRTGDFDSTKEPTMKIETNENINVKNKDDLYTELKKLKELRNEGILSEVEYQSQKKKILTKY